MFQALPRSHRAAISTVSIFAARMAAFLNALSDINDRVHPGISENRIYATSLLRTASQPLSVSWRSSSCQPSFARSSAWKEHVKCPSCPL
jgi:hypothetical protein